MEKINFTKLNMQWCKKNSIPISPAKWDKKIHFYIHKILNKNKTMLVVGWRCACLVYNQCNCTGWLFTWSPIICIIHTVTRVSVAMLFGEQIGTSHLSHYHYFLNEYKNGLTGPPFSTCQPKQQRLSVNNFHCYYYWLIIHILKMSCFN